MFDSGISKEGNILDVGIEQGMITKAGAFFSYGDTRLGQGRESAKGFLKQNPELAREIEEKIRASAVTAHHPSSTAEEE
jgi:recombination protein RecA